MAKTKKQLKKLQKALPKRTRKMLKRYISPATLGVLTTLVGDMLADYLARRESTRDRDGRARATLGPALE